MTPDDIVAALARHGTRIAIDEGRVCLIFGADNAPPDDLIQAAGEATAALWEIAEAQENREAEEAENDEAPLPAALPPTAATTRPPANEAKVALRVIAEVPFAAPLPAAIAGNAPELRLQSWGVAREDVRQLVQRLHAVGADAGKIIMGISAAYARSERLPRLMKKLLRMELERARRDQFLAGLGDGPKTQTELAALAGVTCDVASKLLARMLRDGEIVKTAYGTYALPQQTETAYTPTNAAIINAFLALPDFRGDIAQLVDGTGRDRIPVYDNAKRMAAKGGHLVRLTRGHGVKAVFELSPETLRKIERREPIRLGHKLVFFEPPISSVSAERPAAAESCI
jgi:hypothetical protein